MKIEPGDIKDGNDLMYHRSGWEPKDFADRGYEVWHYVDWFSRRSRATSIRGMFACKTRGAIAKLTQPGVIHELHRYVDGHDVAKR
jgi:hypothetical protein